MSAPLRLTDSDLVNLSEFLDVLGREAAGGVCITDKFRVEVAGCLIGVSWDSETCKYVVDDVIGY